MTVHNVLLQNKIQEKTYSFVTKRSYDLNLFMLSMFFIDWFDEKFTKWRHQEFTEENPKWTQFKLLKRKIQNPKVVYTFVKIRNGKFWPIWSLVPNITSNLKKWRDFWLKNENGLWKGGIKGKKQLKILNFLHKVELSVFDTQILREILEPLNVKNGWISDTRIANFAFT